MNRIVFSVIPLIVACGSADPGVMTTRSEEPKVIPRVAIDFTVALPILPDDADVKMITAEFYANAATLHIKVDPSVESIAFVESYDDPITIGQCSFLEYENGAKANKRITLHRLTWEHASPQYKRTVLFHELGHCALNLDHAPNTSLAIMNSKVLPDKLSAPSWFQLVRDMFNSSSTFSLVNSNEACE
jgi:hypothetical protein